MSSISNDAALDRVSNLVDSLTSVRELVEQLEAARSNGVDFSKLAPLEGASLNIGIAYSLASLYFMLLRSAGGAIAKHPIHVDLQRIRGFVQRVNKLKNSAKTKTEAPEAASSSSSMANSIGQETELDRRGDTSAISALVAARSSELAQTGNTGALYVHPKKRKRKGLSASAPSMVAAANKIINKKKESKFSPS